MCVISKNRAIAWATYFAWFTFRAQADLLTKSGQKKKKKQEMQTPHRKHILTAFCAIIPNMKAVLFDMENTALCAS